MLPSSIIYLDYNATTPIDPIVMNEMLPLMVSNYGNPSSGDHIFGWQAKEVVENARKSLALNLGANSEEIIFTAGATESINMVLRGLEIDNKNHIITVKTEHNAVLDTCKELEANGYLVTYLNVDENGLINIEELKHSFTDNTLLVSIMWVNNETGVIQPIEEIAKLCKAHDVVIMSDATQAIGKISIDLEKLPIDIIVGSAHKIYGPKGIGLLRIKKELQSNLKSIITGGGQELRKRAGTINVPSVHGYAKAVDLALENLEKESLKIEQYRNKFEALLINKFDIKINGKDNCRLYNASNLVFCGIESQSIMRGIGNKLAASRGSACSTGKITPSHVLSAMGLTDEDAHSAIRFSFGRYTTEEDVNNAVKIISEALEHF